MMERLFTDKVYSLNFNLRWGNANKKKIIYAVLKVNKRQIRISLGIKIYPQFWDKVKQECFIPSGQQYNEIKEITSINQMIYAIKLCYTENINSTYTDVIRKIKDLLVRFHDTKNINLRYKAEVSAIALLNKAFILQYGGNKQKEQKENSTWKQYRRLLDEYFKYMKEEKIPDNIEKALTQVAINDYKNYLINNKLAASSINHKVGIVVRLINKKLVIENDFLKYHITPVKFEQIKDVRLRNENIRTALTDNEVKAIQNAEGLSATQKEYRDIFLMQCYTSMRASDVRKIFTGDYKEEYNEGKQIIIIRAQKSRKENGYYSILVDSNIKQILNRYKKGFTTIDIKVNNDVFQQNLNDSIRKIAMKANLIRIHTYCKSVGNNKEEHQDRLCDIITSHFARHTFISKKVREGYTTDEIKNMTAHTDDAMIDKVYRHITNEDRAKARIMAEERHKQKK